jgi:hypothetical protein
MNGAEETKVEAKDLSSAEYDCFDLEEVAYNIVLEKMIRKERRKANKLALEDEAGGS